MKSGATFTGNIEDVAAFVGKSVRTVEQWVSSRAIESYKEGRNRWFLESSVVKFCAGCMEISKRMAPGEAEEQIRSDWRSLLKARGQWADGRLEDFERRLISLEARFQSLNPEHPEEVAA